MTLYTTFPVGNVNILLVSFLIIIIFNVTSTMETISKEKKQHILQNFNNECMRLQIVLYFAFSELS